MKHIKYSAKKCFMFLVVVGISLVTITCNEEEGLKYGKVISQHLEESFFYSKLTPDKIKKDKGDILLECDYINEKENYGNHLSCYFDDLGSACAHMQACIDKFPDTQWFNITINGDNWECPCFRINCDVTKK